MTDFVSEYHKASDEKLLQLWEERSQLLEEAQSALASEIRNRGLYTPVQTPSVAMTEPPNPDERLVPLARFSTTPQAEMVRELLSQNGLACVLQGGNFGALEPLPWQGGFSEIRLLVRQTELSRAHELYEAFFASNEAALQEDEDTSEQQDEQ